MNDKPVQWFWMIDENGRFTPVQGRLTDVEWIGRIRSKPARDLAREAQAELDRRSKMDIDEQISEARAENERLRKEAELDRLRRENAALRRREWWQR
jgi:hypothetical protein